MRQHSQRVAQRGRARWLLAVGAACVALGVVELGLRLFWVKRLTVSAGIEHPQFHHRLKPSTAYTFRTDEFDVTVHTNRFGLRGPDPVTPKPSGVIRILMVGDSFTFGYAVRDEEVFCHLIESGLRAQGYPVDVINAGVSGYSPTLHYLSLRDQYLELEPDLVVLWYDLGDVQEDHWFQKNLVFDEHGAPLRANPYYVNGRLNWWSWLANHSAVAKWVNNKPVRTAEKMRILGVRGYLKAKLRGERAKVAIGRLKAARQDAEAGLYDRFLLVRASVNREAVERAWALSARYLQQTHQLLAAHGIPFVLGVYPYGMVVAPDEWSRGRSAWGFEEGKLYDATPARRLFQDFAAAEGIPLLDTFEDFRTAADRLPEKLFYDHDGHLTPAGHHVLATHVLHNLQFLQLLKTRQAEGKSPSPAGGHAHEVKELNAKGGKALKEPCENVCYAAYG